MSDDDELYVDLGVALDGTESSDYGGVREVRYYLHRCRKCGALVANADWDSGGMDDHTEWHAKLGS